MEKKEVKLRKIPLKIFIDNLINLYNGGVDFIDLVGKPDEVQDIIGIMYSEEYMAKELREDFYEEDVQEPEQTPPPSSEINIKLSDEDLNQLL